MFESILGIIYGSGHGEKLSQNTPLWFLPCFFIVILIAKLVSDLLKKYKHNIKHITIAMFFLIIGYIVYKYFNYPLPFNIETSLVMLYFYYLGTSLKHLEGPIHQETISTRYNTNNSGIFSNIRKL